MNHVKFFEEFINEQIKNKNNVAIFPGRFQPFHNGHIAALKKTSEIYGVPVIPIQILSKKEKSPFPESLLIKIGQAVQKEFSSWMGDYFLYPQSKKTVIPQMVQYLRDNNYYPIAMGAGSDRIKSYKRQIVYINSAKSDVPMDVTFKLAMVDERGEGGPSGTKVRAAITAGDYETFKSMTPKSVHPFYKELKKYL